MSKIKKNLKRILPSSIKKIVVFYANKINFNKYIDFISENKKFKGIGKGKRVFIVGSGNSIKNLDLNLLTNENVVVLNNGFVIDEYKTIMGGDGIKIHLIAPIHPPQTDHEWVTWFRKLEENVPANCLFFIGLNAYKRNAFSLIKENSLFSEHNRNWYYVGRELPISKPPKNLSKGLDLTDMIYAGEAASIYALILSEYMQFDEVILLGMDHDYFLYDDESKMRVYSKAEHQNEELSRTFNGNFYVEEFYRQYKIFKKYRHLDEFFKSDIFSCSGPVLKVFKRKNFNQLMD